MRKQALIRALRHYVAAATRIDIRSKLDVQYKTAFVLAHRLREAMASGLKALRINGEGQTAEIDGAYFGGHIRPANLAADRIDRRLAGNRPAGRKVVVAMRERGERNLAQVFPTEADAIATIRQRIAKGTIVHADESSAWDKLHANFEMIRINHLRGYSIDGACTNGADSYFSCLRRAELGHHHHIAGPYLVRYAQEAAWREDIRVASSVNSSSAGSVIRRARVDWPGKCPGRTIRLRGETGKMRCIECDEEVSEWPERTAQGYRRFRCRVCGKHSTSAAAAS